VIAHHTQQLCANVRIVSIGLPSRLQILQQCIHLLLERSKCCRALGPITEECGEHRAQGVGDAQHHLSEAAGQDAQQVVVLGLILVHAAKIMVKSSLRAKKQ
jgi:hypothetical protein